MGKSTQPKPPSHRVREKSKQEAVAKKDTRKEKKDSPKAVIQKGKQTKKQEKKPSKKDLQKKEPKIVSAKTGASKKEPKAKDLKNAEKKNVPKTATKSQVVAKQKKTKTKTKDESKTKTKTKDESKTKTTDESKTKTTDESKTKEQEGKRPPALRKAPTTPLANNRAVARGSSASVDGSSLKSGAASQIKVDELSDLEDAQKQARAEGVSLEEFMTKESEKALEEHMRQVMKENEAEKAENEEEESEEEEDSNGEDDDGSANESSEEEEEEEDQAEEDEKSQPASPSCHEDKQGEESEGSSDSESGSSCSSSEDDGEEEKEEVKEEEKGGVTEVAGVSKQVDAGAQKALENIEELWFYVGQGGELSKAVAVKESTGVQIRDKNPDQEMVNALTGPEGPLAAGAAPKVGNLSEAGEKAALESLMGGQVSKIQNKKRKVNKEDKEAEAIGPKTPLEQVVTAKAEILKSATEARKYALGLEHVQYSGELVVKLMGFSKKMESIYKKITTLEGEGCKDEGRFQKILDVVTEQMKWYTEAEAS
eukprot:s919_g11.t1